MNLPWVLWLLSPHQPRQTRESLRPLGSMCCLPDLHPVQHIQMEVCAGTAGGTTELKILLPPYFCRGPVALSYPSVVLKLRWAVGAGAVLGPPALGGMATSDCIFPLFMY